MKLQVSLTEEQFAELPEDLRENYSQSDDGYLLTVEGMTHEDVSGLKTALQKHKDKVAELTQQAETIRSSANESAEQWKKKYLATATQSAIADAAAITVANPKLLTPLLKERVKGEFQDDGSLRFVVKGENGSVLIDKETGDPMTISQYVESMKRSDDYKGIFRGTGNSGGNSFEADGASMPRTITPNKPRSRMSRAEKVDYINEHGQAAFNRLPL